MNFREKSRKLTLIFFREILMRKVETLKLANFELLRSHHRKFLIPTAWGLTIENSGLLQIYGIRIKKVKCCNFYRGLLRILRGIRWGIKSLGIKSLRLTPWIGEKMRKIRLSRISHFCLSDPRRSITYQLIIS